MSSLDEQEIIRKSGEEWLAFSTKPSKYGLEVEVRAHEKVEQFMRGMGDGTTAHITLYGRDWVEVDPLYPLLIYNHDQLIHHNVGASFTILEPGRPLLNEDEVVNLSFLRIQGISGAGGIRFGVKSVYGTPFRRQLRNRVGEEFRKLVLDHIKPVKITLIISSQEI